MFVATLVKLFIKYQYTYMTKILKLSHVVYLTNRCTQMSDMSGVASSISKGDIFIYSCSAQLISFEIKLILKEVNCAEHKYMNMPPSLIELATLLSDIPEFVGV